MASKVVIRCMNKEGKVPASPVTNAATLVKSGTNKITEALATKDGISMEAGSRNTGECTEAVGAPALRKRGDASHPNSLVSSTSY